MYNLQLIETISNSYRAIINYGSGDKEVSYFPCLIINQDNCEAFLSVNKRQKDQNLKIHFRIYVDNPEENSHSYALLYGIPEKTAALGEASMPVKSERKGRFVSRICSNIPVLVFLEIIDNEVITLSGGNELMHMKFSYDKNKLLLFLAACFGLDFLPNELRCQILAIINREQEMIILNEQHDKEEAERRKIETERRKEEAERRKIETERRKEEAERRIIEAKRRKEEQEQIQFRTEAKLVAEAALLYYRQTPGLLATLLGETKKIIRELDFSTSEYDTSSFCKLTKSYPQFSDFLYIRRILTFLSELNILEGPDTYSAFYSYYYNESLFSCCTLNQLYEIIDGETTTEDIIKSFSTGPNSNGCYIATCVYGSYDCPEVWTLRRFRDQSLNRTLFGRLFIKIYYAISPKLVRWFGATNWFRSFWRKSLDAFVKKLKQSGYESTHYDDV